ncbi:MAG: DM13 domain-containing protein [Proteobacteria bacterium]|nr:DM13 domain-containing protein [Pseudomonadota bacterium]
MNKSTAIVFALAALLFVQPAAAEPLGSGLFSGASSHTTSGSVTVTKQNGQYIIELGGDFSLDGAPDPYVALGKGKKPVAGGLGAELASNTGAQRYVIDAGPAVDGATQVIIWCKRYAVPLGIATIE